MGFCLGVLLPTRHQSVLQNIFQKVLEYLEQFEESQKFNKILAGKVDSNSTNLQKMREIEEENKRISKQLAEAQERAVKAEAERESEKAERKKADAEREKADDER